MEDVVRSSFCACNVCVPLGPAQCGCFGLCVFFSSLKYGACSHCHHHGCTLRVPRRFLFQCVCVVILSLPPSRQPFRFVCASVVTFGTLSATARCLTLRLPLPLRLSLCVSLSACVYPSRVVCLRLLFLRCLFFLCFFLFRCAFVGACACVLSAFGSTPLSFRLCLCRRVCVRLAGLSACCASLRLKRVARVLSMCVAAVCALHALARPRGR